MDEYLATLRFRTLCNDMPHRRYATIAAAEKAIRAHREETRNDARFTRDVWTIEQV